jgi:AbrB family looped-hinge helix DNA binding protein
MLVQTTKMSSKGQVVIPEEIRLRLGLKTGEQFLVMGDKDVVILKTLSGPPIDEFKQMIKEARRVGKAAGLKTSDIKKAIMDSRR